MFQNPSQQAALRRLRKILESGTRPIVVLALRERPFRDAMLEPRLKIVINERDDKRIVDMADCVIVCSHFVKHTLEKTFFTRAKSKDVECLRLGTTASLVREVLAHRNKTILEVTPELREGKKLSHPQLEPDKPTLRSMSRLSDDERRVCLLELIDAFNEHITLSKFELAKFCKASSRNLNPNSTRQWLKISGYIEQASKGAGGFTGSWKATEKLLACTDKLGSLTQEKSALAELAALDEQRGKIVEKRLVELDKKVSEIDEQLKNIEDEKSKIQEERNALMRQR